MNNNKQHRLMLAFRIWRALFLFSCRGCTPPSPEDSWHSGKVAKETSGRKTLGRWLDAPSDCHIQSRKVKLLHGKLNKLIRVQRYGGWYLKRFAASCFTKLLPKPAGSKEKPLAVFFVCLLMRKMLSSSDKTASAAASTLFLPLFTSWQLPPKL